MLLVRPVSPALLAFRAVLRSEGQRGGRPWPPQQRRARLPGRRLAVGATYPSRRRWRSSFIGTTAAATTGRSSVRAATASLNAAVSPPTTTPSAPHGACTTAPA